MTSSATVNKTVGIVSLGCDKNRVDSENLLFKLRAAGFEIVNKAETAQVVIVNTCAFILSARKESIDTILEMAEFKKPPQHCEKLVVAGCFPVNHLKELKDNLPEVDAFLAFSDYDNVAEIIQGLYAAACHGDTPMTLDGGALSGGRWVVTPSSTFPGRIVSTPQHYAYLKIAEGCDNRCTYCAIPSIRGRYRSRDKRSLVDEARFLADGGVKELILVAQDTTRYGVDLSPDNLNGAGLVNLADELSKIDGIEWIRLMYCYPELVDKNLTDLVIHNEKVVKYLDIPLQHSESRILKLMGRRTDGGRVRAMLDMVRGASEKIALRSSFIVGFPGETEEEFAALCAFLREYRIDNAGFFGYSAEAGTPAFRLTGRLNQSVIRRRVNAAGSVQREIVRENNKGFIGKTVKVLYEGIDYDKNKLYGRTQYNAPEIDTYVYFDAQNTEIGNFYDIMITGLDRNGYDLLGCCRTAVL